MSEGMMKLLTWVTLVGLVAAHLGVDAFLSPLGRPASDTPGPSAIAGVGLSMGVMFAQPLLLAIVAVFWPARHMLRIGAALTLLILMLYALAHGQSRWSGSIDVNTITAPVVQFLISLIPFLILRRWRKWRIMAPATDHLGLDDGRFSVRALLVCMTIAGMLFALGHWILPPVRWPDAQSTWSKVWINSALVGMISTVALSPVFFSLPLVLGGQLRKQRLFSAVLGVLFVSVVLEFLFAMSPEGGGAEGASLATGLLLGAYGSVILSLLVVQGCGFRLVRAEDDGNTARVEAAHANYTTGCSLSPPIGLP